MSYILRPHLTLGLFGLVLLSSAIPSVQAGGPFARRRARVVYETVSTAPRPQDRLAPTGMLGTFTPTPYVNFRSVGGTGGGYSPLDSYGRENSLAIYGPLSVFRSTSAPLTTVTRGYDGLPAVVEGTTFSNPNLPELSPMVYPTRANNYSALRFQATPPYRDRGTMWIDHN